MRKRIPLRQQHSKHEHRKPREPIPQGKALPNVQQRDRDCRGKEQRSAAGSETRVEPNSAEDVDREAAAGEQEHRKPFGLNHPRQRLFMEENQQNQPDKQRKQNI